MLISWQHASIWLILLWLCTTTSALCPSYCSCKPDEKGKRKVSCIKGGMIQIPTTEFDANTEILEIDAPENSPNILAISPIFQHLKRLEEVIIRRSNIQQIGMHSFWGVPTIKFMDLMYNNITSVMDHNFRGLLNLVELNLDHNLITNLQSGVFKHLTELRILSLKYNLLVELVPRMFMKLGKLRVLKLSGNTFEELDPEAFKDISGTSSIMDSTFKELFRCNRCKEFVWPPIRQCANGHLHCNCCIEWRKSCTSCAGPIQENRIISLEKLHRLFHFPCKFSLDGCEENVPGPYLENHQENCKFFSINCPSLTKCPHVYKHKDIMQHFEDYHPKCVRVSNGEKTLHDSYLTQVSVGGFVILPWENRLFKVMWRADFVKCYFEVIGINLGVNRNVTTFEYVVKINYKEETVVMQTGKFVSYTPDQAINEFSHAETLFFSFKYLGHLQALFIDTDYQMKLTLDISIRST